MKPSALQYLIWIGGGIGVSVVVAWTLLTAHAARPHVGVVTQYEMGLIRDQIKVGFDEVKKDIRELRQEIKKNGR